MAKTTDFMATSVTNDVWLRGCEYVFEHYVNRGIIVYCFGRNDKLLWDGCVQWSEGDLIIDVIRAARYSCKRLREAENEWFQRYYDLD